LELIASVVSVVVRRERARERERNCGRFLAAVDQSSLIFRLCLSGIEVGKAAVGVLFYGEREKSERSRMERGKGSGRKWAVDLCDAVPSSASARDPIGFSRSTLDLVCYLFVSPRILSSLRRTLKHVMCRTVSRSLPRLASEF
jgi:hypothetical protein